MTLILGTSTSLFIPLTGRGTQQEFPLCNENGGLTESWEWKGITHELLNYKLSKKHHGYRLVWDFKFDDWADGETLMKFKAVKNALDNGDRWLLRPRNEEQYYTRQYEIVCTSDNFDVVLDNAGLWHTGFHIQFKTKELIDNIDWTLVLPTTTAFEYAVLLENTATI